MRLTWVGHSCFLAEGRPGGAAGGPAGGVADAEPDGGPDAEPDPPATDEVDGPAEPSPVRVLMDPYATPGCGSYGPVDAEADVVTISHSYDATWHGDLTHVEGVGGGEPVVLADLYGEAATAAGVAFDSVKTFHTAARERPNTTLRFELDGLAICHLGDLGHPLDEDHLEALRPVDIVLAPASGVYVIEPEDLVPVLADLDPAVVVPMHFKNDRIDLDMRPVDDLLGLIEKGPGWPVDRPGTSSVELPPGTLPPGPRVLVLEPLR